MRLEKLRALVRRHQGGLLLDTNVLLLFLAARVSTEFAQDWKRTSNFEDQHIVGLNVATEAAHKLVTTPHVLTEVSNFVVDGERSDPARKQLTAELKDFISKAEERQVRARLIGADTSFERLGVADLAQAHHRAKARPLILSKDLDLILELRRRKLPVANLTEYALTPGA